MWYEAEALCDSCDTRFGYLVLKISKADEDQRFCEALSLLLVGIGGLGAGRGE